MLPEDGAHVPPELRDAWAKRRHKIVSHDSTRIDFHGGGKDVWYPIHFTSKELEKVTDAFVVSLVHRKVTSINLARCSKVTDESIKAIAKVCHKLKELNVAGIESVTDESIKAIATGCRELRQLNVDSCYNITDDSIKAIANCCLDLKEFSVASMRNLTDESINAIANGCAKLKVVDVSFCDRISDFSIKAIAKGCPELKELDVSVCSRISDSSIKAIAESCSALNKLIVYGCRMSESCMKMVSKGLSGLEYLKADHCDLESLPNDFFERITHLRVLDIRNNRVIKLPSSIVKLKHLRDLKVSGNPLQLPPYEVATQGLAAIKRFFEELERGSSVSKLLKVVLVGDSEAGKTSLRNAIAGRPNPRQKDRTIHLDIEKVTLTADLDINVYDCGGQEEYLAAQLPYLTGLALYLVVVDAQFATDEYANALEDKLLRFLIILQNRVPGAIVLPVVTKANTVLDPKSRCLWLESAIGKWLRDTREAVCCDPLDSRSKSPQPPALLTSTADAVDMRHSSNSDKHNFIPLRIQSPALAVSVADTQDVGSVRNSVKAVRDRIVALTKHDPPLLRGVGQQIPSTYVAALKLFGAIAEYGDNDLALESLRDDKAHALGETSRLSPNGTYRPKDELESLWNAYRKEPNGSVQSKVFDDAIQLWEAQGLIFVDAGLVVLQPEFMATIVKPLVDHRHTEEVEHKHFEDVVAQFLKSTLSRDIGSYNLLINALLNFRASGEIDCSDDMLFLSFLWRSTGLEKIHYDQVLQMLATSGVIITVKRHPSERRTVVIVPFRLPQNPDGIKLELFWPKFRPSQERELKLRFESRSGFPTGLAERFVSDVHGLGTALYSWRSGVVVSDAAGYRALAERRQNALHFTVRFESYSTEDADAAWKTLCDAQRILEARREKCFPGFFYKVCHICEECCRQRKRRVSTEIFDKERRKRVFRDCGHRFYLHSKDKHEAAGVTYIIQGAVLGAQFIGSVQGDANCHSKSPEGA